jgi:hypothetical protein
MTAKEFETSLRELHTRKPFLPFTVEYVDGRQVLIDAPYVAFSGGRGGFLGPDGVFHFFDHTNVKQFVPIVKETRP